MRQLRQRIVDRWTWLTTTWPGMFTIAYWLIAMLTSGLIAAKAGESVMDWWDWNFYSRPWWLYIPLFLIPFFAFGLLWTVITLRNLGSGVPDGDVSLIVQPGLPLRFLNLAFLPIRALFRLPYAGIKGWRDGAVRTVALVIVVYATLWFLGASPQARESIGSIWSVLWPIMLTGYVVYCLVDYFIYHRGTGVLVKTDGTVLVVQMKFWIVFLAPLVVELKSSDIDVRSFQTVIIPGLPQIARWSGFSVKHESGNAVTVTGLSLTDIKDRVAAAAAAGKMRSDAATKVQQELVLTAEKAAQAARQQAAQTTP